MQKYFICLLIFIVGTVTLSGQTEVPRRTTFSISVFIHSLGVPFKDFVKTPLNFGFTAGVEFDYSNTGRGNNFQRFELGWFHHKNLNTGVWVKTDYIRRINNDDGLFADFQGGLGYLRDFSNNQSFSVNKNGQYQLNKNSSNGGLLIGLGIGSGYGINLDEEYTLSPFVRYEALIQTPYAEIIPFFPHLLLHTGTKLNKNQ